MKTIKVERQENVPDGDFKLWIQKVSNAVDVNRGLFGASDDWEVWVEVITTSQVIVENHKQGKFYRADYSVDENGTVSFSNVVEVARQYVPVEEAVARSLVDFTIGSLWDGVL